MEKWIPFEDYNKAIKLQKQKEQEFINYIHNNVINEEQFNILNILKDGFNKHFKLFEGSNFSNEVVQNEFAAYLNTFLHSHFDIKIKENNGNI